MSNLENDTNRTALPQEESGSASVPSAGAGAPECWLAFPQLDGLHIAAVEVLEGDRALREHQARVLAGGPPYRYVPYDLAENASDMERVLDTINRTLPHMEQTRTIDSFRRSVAKVLVAARGSK